jgi:feruloyl esterase
MVKASAYVTGIMLLGAIPLLPLAKVGNAAAPGSDQARLTPAVSAAAQRDCSGLQSLVLPQVTITTAQAVQAGEAGTVLGPAARSPFGAAPLPSAPAFCRVAGSIAPTSDSDIKFEVWLPLQGWNGRFQGIGNGGGAGYIDYMGLSTAVSRGYAAASTDTGHGGGPLASAYAMNHPEKLRDFDYRGIHLTAVAAKQIASAFYGTAPHHSYFASCSNGGRQALIEAQRFPEDYDGIIAGAPARFVPNLAGFLWIAKGMVDDPSSALSAGDLELMQSAVVRQCDKNDGLVDGIVSEPRLCNFNPARLQCTAGKTKDCLTSKQVATARKIYSSLRAPDGKLLHTNTAPGSELGLKAFYTPSPMKTHIIPSLIGFFRDIVYGDPSWSLDKFELSRDLPALIQRVGPDNAADNPDLSRFAARKGKLILYQGWADANVPPAGTIAYVDSVNHKMTPAAASQFMRLFMVPGMDHCGGGVGPNQFNPVNGALPSRDSRTDISAALEQWVERGISPNMIMASEYGPVAGSSRPSETAVIARGADPTRPGGQAVSVVRTRPLCAYPKVARWTGKGDPNDGRNFVCTIVKGA